MGAKVIAAASSDEKLALTKEYGADETINYKTENLRDRLKAITGGKGVDVVYDPVGGELAELSVRSLAWLGRFLVIGFAAGDIPKIPLNLLLLKSSSLVGVYWGAALKADPKAGRAEVAELLQWYAEGKLKPCISATFPLEKAADAILAVTNRQTKGKSRRGDGVRLMTGVTFTKQGRIGIATVDNPPVNALSHAVRSGLVEAVAKADADPEVKALVLICAGRTFIAGADIAVRPSAGIAAAQQSGRRPGKIRPSRSSPRSTAPRSAAGSRSRWLADPHCFRPRAWACPR